MSIYLKADKGSDTVPFSYVGMTMDTINSLLSELGYSNVIIITEEEFLALINN